MPRVVAAGVAHHVTQRGIARQEIFTSDESWQVYLALLKEHAQHHRLSILGYCLMSNHVHLLVIPHQVDSMSATFCFAHGRFAQYSDAEQCRSGHFWQNRFYSCPVEESAAGTVLAYIELNPVRAHLAPSADFVTRLEQQVNRSLQRKKGGRPSAQLRLSRQDS
jgi:putative transposase